MIRILNTFKSVLFSKKPILSVLVFGCCYSHSFAETSQATAKTPVAESATPFPPAILNERKFGEGDILGLQFAKQPESAVVITLSKEVKPVLGRVSANKYTISLPSVRLSSPIFAAPQAAPDDFEPFDYVTVLEQLNDGEPLSLIVQIDLRRAARLAVKLVKKKIIVTELTKELEEADKN